MNSLKNKTARIIFAKNLKFICLSPTFIVLAILQLAVTIAVAIVIDLHFSGTLQMGMSQVKFMWYAKYASDVLTFAIMSFYLSYVLLVRQKESGLQNLELRSGVKIYNIFFLRTAIAATILYSLFIINIIFYTCFWAAGDIPTIVSEQNIYPVYGFIFIFLIVIYALCNIIFVLTKLAIASSLIALLIVMSAIAPVFPSMSYHSSYESLDPMLKMEETASANAKITFGQKFLNFISSNTEYEWLLDDFSLLEYKSYEPTCVPNDPFCRYSGWGTNADAWLTGLWLGYSDYDSQGGSMSALEASMKVLLDTNENNPWASQGYTINRLPKYFDFARELSAFLKVTNLKHPDNVASNDDFMFSSRHEEHTGKFKNSKNNLGTFFNDLAKTNFVFEGTNYNKLFSFLAEDANAIVQYNEVDHNVGEEIIGTYESTGTIFTYAYATSGTSFYRVFQRDTYSHSLLPMAFWYLGQTIHYSMTLDNNELQIFNKNATSEYNSKAAMNLMFNPLAQFQFMASGKNYHNSYLTDVFSTNGEYFNLYNNNYLTVELSSPVLNTNGERGLGFDLRFQPSTVDNVSLSTYKNSEIYNISIKQKQYVSIEAMYVMYALVFGTIVYLSYYVFKKKFRK